MCGAGRFDADERSRFETRCRSGGGSVDQQVKLGIRRRAMVVSEMRGASLTRPVVALARTTPSTTLHDSRTRRLRHSSATKVVRRVSRLVVSVARPSARSRTGSTRSRSKRDVGGVERRPAPYSRWAEVKLFSGAYMAASDDCHGYGDRGAVEGQHGDPAVGIPGRLLHAVADVVLVEQVRAAEPVSRIGSAARRP